MDVQKIKHVEVACEVIFRRLQNWGSCFLQSNIVKEILEETDICKPKLIYGYACDYEDGDYIRHFWLEYKGLIIDPSTLSLPRKRNRKLSKTPFHGECLTLPSFQAIQKNSFNMANKMRFWEDCELHCGTDEVIKYKNIKQQIKNSLV